MSLERALNAPPRVVAELRQLLRQKLGEGAVAQLSPAQVRDAVCAQLLHQDLRAVAGGALPDMPADSPQVPLPGPVVLQIEALWNYAAPLEFRRDPDAKRRLFKLLLTDGSRQCVAAEVERVPGLSVETPRGTKLVVAGAVMHYGILRLTGATARLLAGSEMPGGGVAAVAAVAGADIEDLASREAPAPAAAPAARKPKPKPKPKARPQPMSPDLNHLFEGPDPDSPAAAQPRPDERPAKRPRPQQVARLRRPRPADQPRPYEYLADLVARARRQLPQPVRGVVLAKVMAFQLPTLRCTSAEHSFVVTFNDASLAVDVQLQAPVMQALMGCSGAQYQQMAKPQKVEAKRRLGALRTLKALFDVEVRALPGGDGGGGLRVIATRMERPSKKTLAGLLARVAAVGPS